MPRRFPSFLQPEVIPFVEVILIRAQPDAPVPPVVDVTIVPVCPWCPSFVSQPGATSHICPACRARLEEELPADDERDDVDEGSRCGSACGQCGRCS